MRETTRQQMNIQGTTTSIVPTISKSWNICFKYFSPDLPTHPISLHKEKSGFETRINKCKATTLKANQKLGIDCLVLAHVLVEIQLAIAHSGEALSLQLFTRRPSADWFEMQALRPVLGPLRYRSHSDQNILDSCESYNSRQMASSS